MKPIFGGKCENGFNSRLLADKITLTQSRVTGFLFPGFSLEAGLAGLMTV